VFFLGTTLAHAEIVLCGNATTLDHFQLSVDPSQASPCAEPYTQHVVSKAHTAAQRALLTAQPLRYLQVEGGLAVLKSQGERDTIDAALAAEQAAEAAAQAAVVTELEDPACRVATFAQIATRFDTLRATLQGDLDGISNIATAKTELADAFQRVINIMEKMALCLRATQGR
jgi:hypothetical protein